MVGTVWSPGRERMIPHGRRWLGWVVVAGAVLVSATACTTEYHGYDSGIDGVLWRQIAGFEDPLSRQLFLPEANEPLEYLQQLGGEAWDGHSSTASKLEVETGGVVLFGARALASSARVAIFIASGPRTPDALDDVKGYAGPSEVYTCYEITARFDAALAPSVTRQAFEQCPAPLVDLLASDAAFASAEVFDG
jgi:hypothetical protein